MSDVQEAQEEFTITLPETFDPDTISELKAFLSEHSEVFGVKGLVKTLSKIEMHQDFITKYSTVSLDKIKRINGVRNATEKHGDRKRSLRATAKKFYESLNTVNLQRQCNLFGVEYDEFNEDAVVQSLIEKHMALQEEGV